MIEQSKKSHKDIQQEYDAHFKAAPIRDEDRAYLWLARVLLKEKSDLHFVLDLACGGGYFLRQLKNITNGNISLTGIDISGEAIRLARQECQEASYLLGVGESIPFKDQSFDAVTCLGSLEHFLNIGQAVGELQRIGRKNAIFFILVPNLFWYKDLLSVLFTGTRKDRNQTHEHFASLGEWKELLQTTGLKVIKTYKYNGIAKRPFKQFLKDLLIPLRFSYHFLFICKAE